MEPVLAMVLPVVFDELKGVDIRGIAYVQDRIWCLSMGSRCRLYTTEPSVHRDGGSYAKPLSKIMRCRALLSGLYLESALGRQCGTECAPLASCNGRQNHRRDALSVMLVRSRLCPVCPISVCRPSSTPIHALGDVVVVPEGGGDLANDEQCGQGLALVFG